MPISVVPDLLNALFTQAQAGVTEANVYFGTGVSDDPGDYLMINVTDPDGPDWMQGVSTTQDFVYVGQQLDDLTRNEEGDVPCCALSWNGNTDDAATVIAAAYATAGALSSVCRDNPTLGLANLLWVSFGVNTDLLTVQNASGSLARLDFQIHFKALV